MQVPPPLKAASRSPKVEKEDPHLPHYTTDKRWEEACKAVKMSPSRTFAQANRPAEKAARRQARALLASAGRSNRPQQRKHKHCTLACNEAMALHSKRANDLGGRIVSNGSRSQWLLLRETLPLRPLALLCCEYGVCCTLVMALPEACLRRAQLC
jgi:hypothetical protein